MYFLYLYIVVAYTLDIDKVVTAQWACALVAALEPPEQTHRVEGILASCASFVRCLHVR